MAFREQLILTARQFIKAHNDKNITGEAGIIALTAPDFTSRSFPASLQHPDRARDEYVTFHEFAFTLFDEYEAAEVDLVVDELQRKVICYLNTVARGPAGEYRNEYVHKLTMTEDGKLVRQFDAFMDSRPMVEFMGKVQALKEGAK